MGQFFITPQYKIIIFTLFIVSILATELTGPNICSREEKTDHTVWVSYSRPQHIRTVTWCFNVPPRCSTYRTLYVTAYKQEVRQKVNVTKYCCDGYEEKDGICVQSIKCENNGTLTENGTCLCSPGYLGQFCEKKCPIGSYGLNCAKKCHCYHGTCNVATGICECFAGFTGEKCDDECPRNTFGVDCHYTCNCSSQAKCNPEDGSCLCPPGFMGDKFVTLI
ncbi:putative multiple epidermal growth factor-like protein 10 [Caerostris darwini]|uniref:Multiple epidermal growth factor-like protein 10 n=1 Tax=Caerostris darwini TaxID=1538125 RepID=A0AAV4UJK5_9ARAC|nr:putative multiple epidermal growth factor-like protein 10 [Caerostris darwini]